MSKSGNLSLTIYLINSNSCKFLRYSLRKAAIVYRLIGASLIGKIFHDPLLLKKNLAMQVNGGIGLN